MHSKFHIKILTLFPEMFPGILGQSLAGKALEKNIWSYEAINIRDYAKDAHKTVDDTPCGGGAGMIMKPDILDSALKSNEPIGRFIYMSPRGKTLTQKLAEELIQEPQLTILCGRYEGVDQRLLDTYSAEEISVGDYILSGGEPAAMILIDSCIRLLPDVLGNKNTHSEESFGNGLLEYPHYTRPVEWITADGIEHNVPEVLTSGNHAEIAEWRFSESEKITKERRPDLWEKYSKSKS